MAYTAIEVAEQLGEQLNDTDFETWGKEDVIFPKINEAQLLIGLLRPDALSTIANVTLAASLLQSAPTGSLRILDITRNLGVGGATPGKPIRKIDRRVINETIPSWTTATTATRIEHFILDPEHPKRFSVYPTPSIATLQVEMIHSAAPTKIDKDGDALSVGDDFLPALLEWVLYRVLSNPAAGADAQMAITHRNNLFNMLGVKWQSDQAIAQMMQRGL